MGRFRLGLVVLWVLQLQLQQMMLVATTAFVVRVVPPRGAHETHGCRRRWSSRTANNDSPAPPPPPSPAWLDQGLLLSSFTDGLQCNPNVQNWFCGAIVKQLWKEYQLHTQQALKKSAVTSPCNGPDPVIWHHLEQIDHAVQEIMQHHRRMEDLEDSDKRSSSWQQQLELLRATQRDMNHTNNKINEDDNFMMEIRLLFIPTASYALRRDSTKSPGKQRQRARADGKQRRTEMVNLILQTLGKSGVGVGGGVDGSNTNSIVVQTVTLDLDDGSIKQPEESSLEGMGEDDDDDVTTTNTRPFVRPPSSGHEALGTWHPHIIYVQGGNTFWLHHCIEKRGWTDALIEACRTKQDGMAAIYCGVSAGAIVVGSSMQTACWKEWDDPSVVPGMETYEKWKDVQGLSLVGSTSFFPHMEDRWKALVEKRRMDLPAATQSTHDDNNNNNNNVDVCCLADIDACFVDGHQQSISILSPVPSLR